MTKQEFEKYCFSKAPEHLQPYIPDAVKAAEILNVAFYPNDANRVVLLAQDRYDAVKDIGVEKPPETLLELSPEGIVQSDMLLADILPEIIQSRRSLFGQDSPPFQNDIDGALRWLDQEISRQAKILEERTSQLTLQGFIKLLTKTIPRYIARQSKNLPGHQFKPSIELLTFPYRDLSGQMVLRQILRGTGLHKLKETLERLAQETGFSFEMLLIFLLAGIPPARPAIRIRTSIGRAKIVSVDFLQRLSYGEMFELHKLVRYAFRAGKKAMSSKNLEIYQLVEAKGGVPQKEKKPFWIQLCEEWNASHPNEKFKSYESLKGTYNRMVRSQRSRIRSMRTKPEVD